MIKKVYGINNAGEQVELNFERFLIITHDDNQLVIDTKVSHPQSVDLLLNIESSEEKAPVYFNILPGACNLMFVKVCKADSDTRKVPAD